MDFQRQRKNSPSWESRESSPWMLGFPWETHGSLCPALHVREPRQHEHLESSCQSVMSSLMLSGWCEYSHWQAVAPRHGSALCRHINTLQTVSGLKTDSTGLSTEIWEGWMLPYCLSSWNKASYCLSGDHIFQPFKFELQRPTLLAWPGWQGSTSWSSPQGLRVGFKWDGLHHPENTLPEHSPAPQSCSRTIPMSLKIASLVSLQWTEAEGCPMRPNL